LHILYKEPYTQGNSVKVTLLKDCTVNETLRKRLIEMNVLYKLLYTYTYIREQIYFT